MAVVLCPGLCSTVTTTLDLHEIKIYWPFYVENIAKEVVQVKCKKI